MPATSPPMFGEGTKLEVNDGASAAFAEIPCVTLQPPGSMVADVERKRLAVTGLKERRPSPRVDNGQVSFTYEMADAQFIRIDGLKGVFGPLGAAAKSFRVTYPHGLRLAFTGYVQKNMPDNVTDGEAISTATAAITVTSLLTITDETSNT